jgi:hypothetical protein
MNKKIIVPMVCMVLLATIPLAAGLQTNKTTSPTPEVFSAWTTVKGKILGHWTGQHGGTTFFAISVHYTVHKFLHTPHSGVFTWRIVHFTGKINGQINMHYIDGTFKGRPISK